MLSRVFIPTVVFGAWLLLAPMCPAAEPSAPTVRLEIRFLRVPEELLKESVDRIMDGTVKDNLTAKTLLKLADSETGMALLNDKQQLLFQKGVLIGPRTAINDGVIATVVNGNDVRIWIDKKSLGEKEVPVGVVCGGIPFTPEFLFTALPVVLADRQHIKMALIIDQGDSAKAAKATIHQIVTVADGDTVLLGSFQRMTEVEKDTSVPVLSAIPYLNDLFPKVGVVKEPQRVFVLVTAHIVSQKVEEEERQSFPRPYPMINP